MSLVSLPTSRDESATAATSAAAAAAPAPRGLHLDRTMTVESSSLTKKRPWDDDKDNMDTSSLPSWNASNINTNHVNNDKECPPVSLPSVMVAPTALPAATTAATAATTTTAAQPRLLPTKDPKISVDDEAKRSAIVQLFSESDGPTSPWNAIADGSITTATMAIDKDRAVLRTSFGDTARTTTTTITTRTTINTIDAIVCLEEDQEQDVLHPPDKSITSSHVMTNANGVGDGTDGTTNNADAPTSSFVAATKKSRTQRYEIDTKVKKVSHSLCQDITKAAAASGSRIKHGKEITPYHSYTQSEYFCLRPYSGSTRMMIPSPCFLDILLVTIQMRSCI